MLADLLARQRSLGFSGIAGAAITGTVPVTERLLQFCVPLLMTDVPGNDRFKVNGISIRDNNVLVVNVSVRKWVFAQTLNLELAIDPIVDVPRDPYVRVRLLRAGIVGVLAELFGKMPKYATFSGGLFSVDLRGALAAFGAADVFPLLRYIGVTTQSGKMTIDFRLGVAADKKPIVLP